MLENIKAEIKRHEKAIAHLKSVYRTVAVIDYKDRLGMQEGDTFKSRVNGIIHIFEITEFMIDEDLAPYFRARKVLNAGRYGRKMAFTESDILYKNK